MKNIFTEHPNEQNESYLEHACFASKCGIRLIFLGIAAIIHALFPFVFILAPILTPFEAPRRLPWWENGFGLSGSAIVGLLVIDSMCDSPLTVPAPNTV